MFYTESDIDYLFDLLGISGVEDFEDLTKEQQNLVNEIFAFSYN